MAESENIEQKAPLKQTKYIVLPKNRKLNSSTMARSELN